MKKLIIMIAALTLTSIHAQKIIPVPVGTSDAKKEYIEDVIWIKDTIIKNMGIVMFNTGLSEAEILRKLAIAEERAMLSYN